MNPGAVWRRIALLAAASGAAFWLANFAISLTPVAADYRAALSISYVPMLIEALLGGLIVGFVVSFFLVRFRDRIPMSDSMSKALVLSFIALVVATLVLEVPAKLVTATDDGAHLFLVMLVFNGVRFLALGVTIGYFNDRLERRMGTWRPMHERR